jgi:hypothetical protein
MADTQPTANHSITDFITAFKGGTRQNRFVVTGTISSTSRAGSRITTPFHIRSASIPEAATTPIAVNYRGRSVAYSGDRTYLPWAITVLDDHSGNVDGGENLHKAFHDWQDVLNSHKTNISTMNGTDPTSLWQPNWTVSQYGTNCDTPLPGRIFTLYNVWPISVGPIDLDMSADNTLASFAVTLAYSHYTYDGAPISG